MTARAIAIVVAILILLGIGALLIRPLGGGGGSQPQHAITQD